MKIEFEGRTWSYDDDLITVGQAEVIEAAPGGWSWTLTDEGTGEAQPRSGRSVYDWRQAVGESSARAFRYLYWVMREQNGDPVPLEEVSFAFPRFVAAFLAGWRAEVEARLAEAEQEEAGPTRPPGAQKPEPKPARQRKAPSRSPSPGS
jgi:hypothetical protein